MFGRRHVARDHRRIVIGQNIPSAVTVSHPEDYFAFDHAFIMQLL